MSSSISSPSNNDNKMYSMNKTDQSNEPLDDCPNLLTDISDSESNFSLPLNNDFNLPNEQVIKSETNNILPILNIANTPQHSKENNVVFENKSQGINYCRGKIDIEIDLLSSKSASVKGQNTDASLGPNLDDFNVNKTLLNIDDNNVNNIMIERNDNSNSDNLDSYNGDNIERLSKPTSLNHTDESKLNDVTTLRVVQNCKEKIEKFELL